MNNNLDVLAVMEEAAHALNSVDYRIERDELLEAIAAVAELIEAASEYKTKMESSNEPLIQIHRRRARAKLFDTLSRVKGGAK